MGPLSALCFVAGDGIGVFDLQGVQMDVLLHFFHTLLLAGNIVVVVPDGIPKGFLLFGREGGALALKRVHHDGSVNLHAVVVGQFDRSIGKAQAVELALVAVAAHDGHIAVGQEGRYLVFFGSRGWHPPVIVLHNHDAVARAQFLGVIQDAGAYALIEEGRTLVAACHHDGFVFSHAVVALFHGLQ